MKRSLDRITRGITKEEEEYVICELGQRCTDIQRWQDTAGITIREDWGGIKKILEGNSEDRFTVTLHTVFCAGDIMQILQRYRDDAVSK